MDLSEDWLTYYLFEDLLDVPNNLNGMVSENSVFSHINGNKIFFDNKEKILSVSLPALKTIINFDIMNYE